MESSFPPFPVSPSGGKPGAPPPPLRCGSGTAPVQSQTLIRVLDRKGRMAGRGSAPVPVKEGCLLW